ncbi:hypothetical protein [Thermogutta sp.]|uniref:hypothetical protein n=1 Tax=Thermogutta sp. TaxID=1962930 RepID=UPI003C7CE9B6
MGLKIRAADLRELLDISDPAPEEEFLQNPAYRSLEQANGEEGKNVRGKETLVPG